MKWQDMYEIALERIKQLNKEVDILHAILRSYLPIINKENNEKRWVVSMCKVVQFNSRCVQFILLCSVCFMANVLLGSPEYSSVGIYQKKYNISAEDRGEITFFIIYVITNELGKMLDNGYQCPVYCGVNHKHRMIENEAEKEGSTNEKTDPGIYRPVVISDRREPKSDLWFN